MSKEKRGLGDNQNPVTDSAIKLIDNIRFHLVVQKGHCEEEVIGKNKTVRDNATINSLAKINSILRLLKPWNEVIDAKLNGADIHAAPIKTHKLEIVAGREHKFGQYIIDKESKQLKFDFDKENLND